MAGNISFSFKHVKKNEFKEDSYYEKMNQVLGEFNSMEWDKRLKSIRKLGYGASGNVLKVRCVKTKRVYARKVISINQSEMKPKAIYTEVEALNTCKHENVISMKGAYYQNGSVNIILDYMNLGSVQDLILTMKRIPEEQLAKIALQILSGLDYLHNTMKIVHRDIKPANILLNDQGIVKIADFGMAGLNRDHFQNHSIFRTFQGSFPYMSPERIKSQAHSYNSDIWSLGLTIAEAALGRYPIKLDDNSCWSFMNKMDENSQKHFEVDLPVDVSKEFREFIELCCTVDPKTRPNARALMSSDFIRKNIQAKPSYTLWLRTGYATELKKRLEDKKKLKTIRQ